MRGRDLGGNGCCGCAGLDGHIDGPGGWLLGQADCAFAAMVEAVRTSADTTPRAAVIASVSPLSPTDPDHRVDRLTPCESGDTAAKSAGDELNA
jgi:hypothetical protein